MRGSDVQLFFTTEDERAFSTALRVRFPEVVFIDWLREFTPEPSLRSSLELCETNMAMIWNRGIYPSWPRTKVTRGMVQGPDVLDFHRCRLASYQLSSDESVDALTSGSLGWGGETRLDKGAEMRSFSQEAIKLVASMHTGLLAPFGYTLDRVPRGGVRGYTVGPAASRWCAGRADRVLKVNAGRHLYTSFPTE